MKQIVIVYEKVLSTDIQDLEELLGLVESAGGYDDGTLCWWIGDCNGKIVDGEEMIDLDTYFFDLKKHLDEQVQDAERMEIDLADTAHRADLMSHQGPDGFTI